MAKPFQEQVNIQPQTIATGQSQVLQSLSQKLDDFSSFTGQIAAEKTIERAAAQGQQAASQLQQGERPEFKEETFVGGVAKKAYNQALRSSYVAGVDRDLNLRLNAIKDLNSDDLLAFNTAAEAEIKGAIEGVDPATRGLILQSANDFMDSARINVQSATIQKTFDEADEEQVLSSDYYGGEADKAAFSGDSLTSIESLNKVVASNQARFDSGKITESQLALLNDDAILSTKIAANRGELNRTMEMPGGIQIAAKAIAQMTEKPLKGLSLEQNDELVTTLSSDLSQFVTNLNRQEVADQASLTSRQNNNYSLLLVSMSEGDMDQESLNASAKKGNISGAQFKTLSDRLSSQGVGVTDVSLKLDIQTSIAEGVDMVATIDNNTGSNLSQADAGALLKMQIAYGEDESVLNQSNTKRYRTYMTDSMKITGIFGRLTDDSSKKSAAAILEYDTRVLAGEEPEAVAMDLYDRDSLTKLDSQLSRKHNTNDVKGAIRALTDQARADVVTYKNDPAELENKKRKYNRELELLQNLQALQISQEQFDKSLKGIN